MFNILFGQTASSANHEAATKHEAVAKTTCWSSERASDWGRKAVEVTLNVGEQGCWCRNVLAVSVLYNLLLIYWDLNIIKGLQWIKLFSEWLLCGWKCLGWCRTSDQADWWEYMDPANLECVALSSLPSAGLVWKHNWFTFSEAGFDFTGPRTMINGHLIW